MWTGNEKPTESWTESYPVTQSEKFVQFAEISLQQHKMMLSIFYVPHMFACMPDMICAWL